MLISPRGNVTAFGSVPRAHTFLVAGVFDIGMSEIDSGVIFMPLPLAHAYFKYPDAVTSMEIRVDNADNALYWAKEHGRNQVASYAELAAAGEFASKPVQSEIELF